MRERRLLAAGGFPAFTWIWAGQVLSNLGSGLTRFAIGVWVLHSTGSVTRYTFIAFCATVPAVFLSPFAGALVDRWSRRRTMILSDSAAATTTVVLVILLATKHLEVWHIYLLVAVSSAFNSLQIPAFSAATTLLVPKRHFTRAGGMVQMGNAGAQVLSPILAGFLLDWIAMEGVILIDFATFLVAVTILGLVVVPEPERKVAAPGGPKPSLWREAGYGWTYIRERPGLLRLLGFFAALNLLLPFALVLITPLVLSFAGPGDLGWVLGLGSAGAFLGGLAMSTWGGPKRRVAGVLGAGPVLALGWIVAGLQPSLIWIAAGFFTAMLVLPMLNASSQAIWQAKVEPAVQGRVFAMRRLIAQATGPFAFLAAGPLADFLNSLLAEGGSLAPTFGPLVGVGPGRGIGLLFVVVGALFLVVSAIAVASPRLRQVEDEIPDAVGDPPAAS